VRPGGRVLVACLPRLGRDVGGDGVKGAFGRLIGLPVWQVPDDDPVHRQGGVFRRAAQAVAQRGAIGRAVQQPPHLADQFLGLLQDQVAVRHVRPPDARLRRGP
jgi:hypothetical protein